MQLMRAGTLFLAVTVADAARSTARTNPLGKVLDLMADLTAKITKEGEAEAKAYAEYVEWCDDATRSANQEIETATKKKGKLEAKISELEGALEASAGKIEDLAASIASSEAEKENATSIREKEATDFAAAEKELMETVDALERATAILEREMAKNPALAQVNNKDTKNILSVLSTVVDAAGLSSSDRKRLLSLAQNQQSEEDAEFGAPAAATYKTHSGDIFDVLEDLKTKAEGELADLRKTENTAKQNYAMLKQSLEAQINVDNKDLAEEKAAEAQASEEKAAAEGELSSTKKALAASKGTLADTQSGCMQTAADHDATVAARTEELAVIAKAKQILEETSKGAVEQSYSLLQSSNGNGMRNGMDLANSEVVALVKRLAKKHHSSALAQLANHVSAILRYGGANGEDVFAKVKGLIQDLIEKLEAEASADAEEKAYCDEQMAKTEEKKGELEDDVSKLTVKIDKATARTAQLKGEVKELEDELSALAKLQAEMDKLRQETHADFMSAKADLELGLGGVRKALSVLRNYYESGSFMQQPAAPEQHSKASGAGSSIIGILEVVESDFATDLSKETTQEQDAQSEYEKVTQENAITKTTKTKDVEYKTKEIASLAKTLTELNSDRDSANEELAAVNEYYAKIKERCIAKPETYEERKQRREAEIAGLKEALNILENETALLQRQHRRSTRASALSPR